MYLIYWEENIVIGYTEEEVMEFIEDNDVKFIRLAFCDIFGRQKNISIMPGELRKAFDTGVNFKSFLVLGYDDPDHQDLFLKPDPSTLNILPWRPQQGRVIRFFCDIVNADGEPFLYDSRKFLKDTMKECKNMGFTVRLGLRSEFYLFKTDEEGNPTDTPMDNGGYFDIAPLDKCENIRREICLTLEEMGIQPESSHHEIGPGQNEIDFKTSDAMSTADNYITYQHVVGAVASRFGVHASFEPKPIKGESGNGLHMKISTYKGGVNIEDVDPEFTAHFMAGVYNRMRDITLFLNTRKVSYDRFGENEAPKYITWSTQNKSRLIRVPVIRGKKPYFILRSPDAGINPYLAFAMVIQAGLAGVRNEEILPPPVDKKFSEEERNSYGMLPLSLQEAVNCAKQSEFLQQDNLKDISARFIKLIEENELA